MLTQTGADTSLKEVKDVDLTNTADGTILHYSGMFGMFHTPNSMQGAYISQSQKGLRKPSLSQSSASGMMS